MPLGPLPLPSNPYLASQSRSLEAFLKILNRIDPLEKLKPMFSGYFERKVRAFLGEYGEYDRATGEIPCYSMNDCISFSVRQDFFVTSTVQIGTLRTDAQWTAF